MMLKKSIAIMTLTLAIYMLLNSIKIGGIMSYFMSLTLWSFLTLLIIWASGLENLKAWHSKPVTIMATVIAVVQLLILMNIGIFTGFGGSPYAFTPTAILVNMAYFSSALIAIELSRAYAIKSCLKRKIFTGMALTALFYTFISFPLTKFLTLGAPAETAKFLGSDFLPAFAQSLFATYLALLGGPVASIAYLGILEAFEWLSPILPNPPWALKALITTLIPVAGFLIVSETVSPFKLLQLGIISRAELKSRVSRAKKFTGLSWVTIAVVGVILILGSTGLLGFQPSIIASGSMRPTLDVGDVAITVQMSPDKIKVGDIIQYWRAGDQAPTIHRVIEISHAGGTTYITTKGDANTAPDEPIVATVSQRLGKVVLVIPKIGWVSIYLKNFAAQAWSLLTNNIHASYTILGITLISTAIGIHRYRNQPLRKLRRRLKR
jgi:signal peptidase